MRQTMKTCKPVHNRYSPEVHKITDRSTRVSISAGFVLVKESSTCLLKEKYFGVKQSFVETELMFLRPIDECLSRIERRKSYFCFFDAIVESNTYLCLPTFGGCSNRLSSGQ